MLFLIFFSIFIYAETYINRHDETNTNTSHIFLISALNGRYAANQAQNPDCMINSSIDEFPQDIFTSKLFSVYIMLCVESV